MPERDLVIPVYVQPRAAILAGKTRVGNQSFVVTEEALAALPEPLRLELALAYEANRAIGLEAGEPAVVEPSIEAVRPVLEARAAGRAKADEAARVAAARAAEEAAVTARDSVAKDNARSKALRAWIEKHGDDEQKARMAEGFLPEDEILEAICDELLELPGFDRYDNLRRGDACECACAGAVSFTVREPPQYMDAHQFMRLQQAREQAPDGATVSAVEHRAACPKCKCVPIARLEARVSMRWNGWLLVRQYALV